MKAKRFEELPGVVRFAPYKRYRPEWSKPFNAGLHNRLSGLILSRVKVMKRTREEVASTIDGFINDTGRQWDWDGFTSIRIDDPELESIRKRCVALPVEFPPSTTKEYCSEAGMRVMRELVQGLRSQLVGRS
jgi:hypothetical protein